MKDTNKMSFRIRRGGRNLSASDIFGSLFANGQLILVNPNGITFHESADVRVGSLIASAASISSDGEINHKATAGLAATAATISAAGDIAHAAWVVSTAARELDRMCSGAAICRGASAEMSCRDESDRRKSD